MRREGLGGRAARPAVVSPYDQGRRHNKNPPKTGCVARSFYARRLLRPLGRDTSAVAFSATGALLFTCVVGTQSNMSGPIFLYDTNDRPRRRELDLYGLGSGIRKTEFSTDGSLLAVVGSNSNVALYDTATAKRRLIPRP